MEIFLDDPKQALPVLDQMGFKNYQVTDKNTIHIYERLDESAAVNMELAKAGVSVRGIGYEWNCSVCLKQKASM